MTEDDITGVYVKQQKYVETEGEDCDDSHSDSGLVTQFCTVEGNINSSTETLGASVTETPIEKEIRKSIAREQSLRRSRGLPNLPSAPEYVEVNLRKNVLSQSHAFKSERFQGKDRQFAGKKMLQDIYEEAQREEDLVRIGKVLGFYDKGTVRQLKERKHVFEAFQKPSDSTLAPSMRSKTSRLSSSSGSLTLDDRKDISSKAPITKDSYRRSVDPLGFTDFHTSARGGSNGAGFSEGLPNRNVTTTDNGPTQKYGYFTQEVKRPESTITNDRLNRSSSGTAGHGGVTRLLQQNNHDMVEKEAAQENPFIKLRSSSNVVKVQQDIHEAQEREKELQKQRISLYGGKAGAALVEDMMPSMSATRGLAFADLADSEFGRGTEPSAGWCRYEHSFRILTFPNDLVMWVCACRLFTILGC